MCVMGRRACKARPELETPAIPQTPPRSPGARTPGSRRGAGPPAPPPPRSRSRVAKVHGPGQAGSLEARGPRRPALLFPRPRPPGPAPRTCRPPAGTCAPERGPQHPRQAGRRLGPREIVLVQRLDLRHQEGPPQRPGPGGRRLHHGAAGAAGARSALAQTGQRRARTRAASTAKPGAAARARYAASAPPRGGAQVHSAPGPVPAPRLRPRRRVGRGGCRRVCT